MREERLEAIWHGVVAGIIGYAAIAIGVSIGDIMQGRSAFYTVSLLGEWLFYGLKDPGDVRVWPGAVFAFNGVHLVTFLGFGLVASWLACQAERGPLFWYAGLVLYLFVFLHLFAGAVFMTEPVRQAVSLWQMWVPSLIAVVLMSWYLLAMHPRLRREMRTWVDDTDVVHQV